MASFVRPGRVDRSAPERAGQGGDRRVDSPSAFVLYVEGPRDHDLLRIWANHLSRRLARTLEPCGFILGGRRPARAIEDFRGRGGAEAGLRGIVVLDRDHHDEGELALGAEPGLELFTWRRRHIESYVLVPAAIRRVLERSVDMSQLDRLMADLIPDPEDEPAFRSVNAKRLLGHKGPLAGSLGQGISPRQIARAMRAEELHSDVLQLFSLVRSGLGLVEPPLEVVKRPLSE